MFRIKRTKLGSVHYAAAIAKAGSVTGWTKDRELAAHLPSEAADKVQAFYAGLDSEEKKRAGTLECEPVSAAEIQAAIEKQQEEAAGADRALRAMADEIDDLRKRVAALEGKPAATLPITVGAAGEKKDKAAK